MPPARMAVMSMALPIKTVLAHRQNYGKARDLSQIKYIIVHYTSNDGDHDEGNASYFKNNVVQASAHYFVDDDSITQTVPDNYVAWAVGGSKWRDCATTGGGKMYGIITNTNSLSVEMCDTVNDGTVMATETTMRNTADLVKSLMKKYNVDINHVYRHFDVNGKHCPKFLMSPSAWSAFKERLVDSMPEEIYNTLDEVPSWAKETVKKLIAHGSLKGDTAGNLNLDLNMLRILVINDREGCYDK